MTERVHKSPGPDHPITIEPNPGRGRPRRRIMIRSRITGELAAVTGASKGIGAA
jgi:hypothetical protein